MTQATDIPLIDIRPDHWEIVRGILQKHVPQYEVWAFGSRAKWTAKPYSDLDLAIIADTPISPAESTALADDFSESDLPWKVDVVDWAVTTETFRQIIARDKVVVQSSEMRGEAFAGWRESTWGEEISLEYGKGIRGYADAVGPYRVFGSNGPIGWTSEILFHGPGVILGRKGAYRGVQFSKEPFFVIDTAYYVVPKSDLDMRWLYYAIVYHKLGEIDDGSPIPSTTRAAVYVRDLKIPPPAEQQEIATVLGSLDDKIDLNRRMNETLEAMARAVFKDWFVDFGPVRAKAEGRQPPGLSPDIAALFPDALDDEDKPVGWKYGPISELCDRVENGGTPSRNKPEYWEPSSVPWLTSGEVRSPVVISTAQSISPEGMACSSAKLWPAGTTIVAMYGATAGEVCMLGMPTTANQACCGLIPKQKFREYLFLSSRFSRHDLASKATGSAQQNLSQRVIAEHRVTIPTHNLVEQFSVFTGNLFEKWIANEHENVTLTQLRDLLLPKLMSGEIRLKDAETAVEAVA